MVKTNKVPCPKCFPEGWCASMATFLRRGWTGCKTCRGHGAVAPGVASEAMLCDEAPVLPRLSKLERVEFLLNNPPDPPPPGGPMCRSVGKP